MFVSDSDPGLGRGAWDEAGLAGWLEPALAGKAEDRVGLEEAPWFDSPPKRSRPKTDQVSRYETQTRYLSLDASRLI